MNEILPIYVKDGYVYAVQSQRLKVMACVSALVILAVGTYGALRWV